MIALGCMLYINFCRKHGKDFIVPQNDWPQKYTKVHFLLKIMALNTLKDVVKDEDLEEIRLGCFEHLLDTPVNNLATQLM